MNACDGVRQLRSEKSPAFSLPSHWVRFGGSVVSCDARRARFRNAACIVHFSTSSGTCPPRRHVSLPTGVPKSFESFPGPPRAYCPRSLCRSNNNRTDRRDADPWKGAVYADVDYSAKSAETIRERRLRFTTVTRGERRVFKSYLRVFNSCEPLDDKRRSVRSEPTARRRDRLRCWHKTKAAGPGGNIHYYFAPEYTAPRVVRIERPSSLPDHSNSRPSPPDRMQIRRETGGIHSVDSSRQNTESRVRHRRRIKKCECRNTKSRNRRLL